jgi:transposase
MVLPRGVNQLRKQLPEILEDGDNKLSALSRRLVATQYQALKDLDEAIKALEREISAVCQQHALSRRLVDIPGIGPLTAVLAAADVGDGKDYHSSRDYAASLGVVPRQHSSGDKQVLLGISKRGNRSLRTSLIHGARSVLWAKEVRRAHQGRRRGWQGQRRLIDGHAAALPILPVLLVLFIADVFMI